MNLFDRIPPGLFGPLTGKNSRRAWELLARFAERYFGPDAVPTYADGYLHEQITKEIERFLLDKGWESEAGEPVGTPINIQANMLLTRLVETGWLVEDRVGARRFISMRPVVARFLETLQQFAVEGPQLISGNIQLVYSQLRAVADNPRTQAAGFISAAQLCVRLINSLNATTLRARDLMKELTQEQATPVFVKRFFSEHIAELYVRDFRELRTENHPLRLRYDIIELVSRVAHEEPARSELLQGYRELPGSSGEETEQLERDVERFRKLLDVERFLERMDRVMESATQRAIAYLGYRLKASDRIEEVIADTINALNKAEVGGQTIEGNLFSPLPVVAEHRLRMPMTPPPKPVRQPMVKREMTVRERAMHMLRKAMISHRDATPTAMKRYVQANLPAGVPVRAADLPSGGVEDAVAFVVLMRMAAIARNNPRAMRANPLLRQLGFNALMSGEMARVDTELFNAPDFTVTREK